MQAAWRNILEDGTVTVTSAESDAPAYRLFDRIFGRQWTATSTATQTVMVDQGASPGQVDTLIIPSGHSLSGCTVAWQYSSDNFASDVHDAVTGWAQSDSGEIFKQMSAPGTHRYWRVTFSGASVAPEAGEIVMALLTTFVGPDFGAIRYKEPASIRTVGIGGQPRYTINGVGSVVWSLRYSLVSETEHQYFRDWGDFWADNQRPFYVVDNDGTSGFFEFAQPPKITRTTAGRSMVEMELRQVY